MNWSVLSLIELKGFVQGVKRHIQFIVTGHRALLLLYNLYFVPHVLLRRMTKKKTTDKRGKNGRHENKSTAAVAKPVVAQSSVRKTSVQLREARESRVEYQNQFIIEQKRFMGSPGPWLCARVTLTAPPTQPYVESGHFATMFQRIRSFDA